MTHGLRMHKLFSKSYYDAAKQIQPFWLRAKTVPENDEVTVITTATADTWDNLVQLTAYWEGKRIEREKKKNRVFLVKGAYIIPGWLLLYKKVLFRLLFTLKKKIQKQLHASKEIMK